MRILFFLLTFIIITVKVFANDSTIQNRVLIAININSCSFCNKATNAMIDESLTGKVDLLFYSEDASPEQIDEFLTANFTIKPRYVFNDKLYKSATQHLKIFKSPLFIILDTSLSVVRTFPIDSIHFYKDLIKATINEKGTKTEISNTRIKRMSGYRRVNKVEDHLFVTGMGNTTKIYDYNLKTRTLDSLCFTSNDKLIYKLLEMRGVKGINVAEVKRIFREKRLPYEIVSFNTRPYSTTSRLYNIMYVEYLDPNKYSDTISTELLFFLYSYDPVARDLRIHKYKHYEKDWESGEIMDDLRLDYITLEQVNDSLWMMGTEHINEKVNNEKTFMYFSNTSNDKELRYNGKRFSVRTDSMVTFDNESMNNPMRLYFYELLASFLYYNESPFYYNYKTQQIFDMRTFSEDCTWIFDMEETDNTLSVLVEENESIVLYNLDKESKRMLKREFLGKNDSKGNVTLDDGNVVYTNKKGDIVSYSH
ncbi:MAG: hypothetical protein V4590_06275 [Bacteroidota bacterium]